MAVPTVITDLSVTPSSNSPAGGDTVTTSEGPDDFLRAHASIIRLVSNAKADLASPTFTGTPVLPSGTTLGGTAMTTPTGTGAAVLAVSPTLTGVPVAPTASPGTSTTQLATTAFVAAASAAASVPTGTIVMFGSATAPTGYLGCDAAAVSRTTYADLFAVVGITWGAGDGSTTFNVPDLRGRAPIGTGTGSGLTARSLAASGGAETHTLITAEMPAHTHNYAGGEYSGAYDYGSNMSVGNLGTATDGRTQNFDTETVGGGGAHNNMQPFAACLFIIKT